MACGLQVFDANGNLDVDTSTGIAKYLGEFTTGFSGGSFSRDELKGSRVWFISKGLVVNSDVFTHTKEPKSPLSSKPLTLYSLDFPDIRFDYKTGAISWTFVDTASVKTDTVVEPTIYKLRRISSTFIYGVV
nr:MAG TPA: hypothetical protein [Caudoviricetes sp.]